MKDVKDLCKNVNENIREQVETLAKAVLAMQNKIETQMQTYESMPIAQMLTTTQGEKALKSNPALAEFRATVRDYSAALDNLQKILDDNKDAAAVSSIAEMRSKFRVAK